MTNLNLTDQELDVIKPFYKNSDISRFFSNQMPSKFIIYSDKLFSQNIEKYPNIIKEIRGRGLLIGIQLHTDQVNFIKKLMDQKLLTISYLTRYLSKGFVQIINIYKFLNCLNL